MRIVSYNVRYFGHGTRGVASTEGGMRKIAAAIAKLDPLPDAIMLQEVETSSLRSNALHWKSGARQIDVFSSILASELALKRHTLDAYQVHYFPAHVYGPKVRPMYTTGLATLVRQTLPVLTETFDKDVVRNALDGLPMYAGFEPGATDVQRGVNKCLEIARLWPSGSATLLVVSDGDTLTSPMSGYIPDSIADTIVIGVGDPVRSSIVGGHSSRQDTMSLKQLSARLGGIYHEGNVKHLPTEVLEGLTMLSPRAGEGLGSRELALVALVSGTSVLALATPLLLAFGRPRTYARARNQVATRAGAAEEATA